MASLQTHVFVNDEWVTQTVSAEELIGETSRARTESTASGAPPPLQPPKCGILTKTVIESPIIRWVLPVQLRSPRFNDVALVGNWPFRSNITQFAFIHRAKWLSIVQDLSGIMPCSFYCEDQSVQISEFGTDNQLKPIAKKVYLGAKIRNCRVMGAHGYLSSRKQDIAATFNKSDDVSVTSSDSSISTSLPEDMELFQQLLVLVLSTGELVFLFMSLTATGDWEFVAAHFPIFSGKLVDPGFHLTISPDWGYMAIACSEDLFTVFQLESMKELRKQHSMRLPIKPIRSVQARAVKGVIHKLEFLHTGSENASHIVLLAIVARSGVLRLAIYEWEDSELLEHVFDEERSGLRLDGTAGLPLLIIPLMISCQFLIITEHSVAICSDVLGGSPVFNPFALKHQDATDWHHGTHRPMWTAWARPSREEPYHTVTDLIYLAREDGWVNILEIRDSSIEASLYLGPLQCNIDSGFASISVSSGDILVTSGDHGHGEIWSVEPRQDPRRVGQLPKWSPTVDLVLAHDASKHSKSDHKKLSKRPSLSEKTANRTLAPGSIFACSGRGISGAIVELRYGIQAKIGLDLLYTSLIKRCWVVPSIDGSSEEGFFMLLALPENSAVLHISQDLSEVSERDQSAVNFDLLSTTLAVHVSRDIAIQITTMHATIVSPNGCYQYSINDMVEDQLATVTDAAVTDETLTLSVYSNGTFKIMVFSFETPKFILKNVFQVEGEVTAISITTLSIGICIVVGLSQSDLSVLTIFPINWSHSGGETPTNCQGGPMELKLGEDEAVDSMAINAVTSIICLGDDKIVIGMRNGDVLTIHPTAKPEPGQFFTVARTNHFGVTPSHVFIGPVLDTGPSSLVCNDAGLAIMKEPNGKPNEGCFEEIFRVWLTDANEPHSPSPTINSVIAFHEILGYGGSTWAMVAGPHIFITEIQPHPAPVPRYIPLGGTPKGIIYSERLKALVTVVVKRGIPSLHFFDPVTGTDLSHPIRKKSGHDDEDEDVDYIESLGNSDTKVISLLHWLYKNKGNVYEWFVILARSGDRQGYFLIVSAEQEPILTNTAARRRIRFWNQFEKNIKSGPPRCGTTDENGLFLSFDTTLEYHIIEDKRFKNVMQYDLPSPATCLKVIDGYLHVLTASHSLIILDYTCQVAVTYQQMYQMHTDAIARNGLHLVDIDLSSGTGERKQRLVLTSDPMCGFYGLWASGKHRTASNFKLVFQAHLPASIRKSIHGYTRPRWTRDGPRYGHLPSGLDKRSILGLAIDGSLTEFVILDEDAWRLLRFIENLAMTDKDISDTGCGPEKTESFQLDPNSIAKIGMHVDGDILQRCLKQKRLGRIVSTPSRTIELQELLLPFGLDTRTTIPPTPEDASLTYEYTYGLLEYYLSPAI